MTPRQERCRAIRKLKGIGHDADDRERIAGMPGPGPSRRKRRSHVRAQKRVSVRTPLLAGRNSASTPDHQPLTSTIWRHGFRSHTVRRVRTMLQMALVFLVIGILAAALRGLPRSRADRSTQDHRLSFR